MGVSFWDLSSPAKVSIFSVHFEILVPEFAALSDGNLVAAHVGDDGHRFDGHIPLLLQQFAAAEHPSTVGEERRGRAGGDARGSVVAADGGSGGNLIGEEKRGESAGETGQEIEQVVQVGAAGEAQGRAGVQPHAEVGGERRAHPRTGLLRRL